MAAIKVAVEGWCPRSDSPLYPQSAGPASRLWRSQREAQNITGDRTQHAVRAAGLRLLDQFLRMPLVVLDFLGVGRGKFGSASGAPDRGGRRGRHNPAKEDWYIQSIDRRWLEHGQSGNLAPAPEMPCILIA